MKAQSAIEFIMAYSWAFLLLLIVAFLTFYYLSAQQVPTRCDFGNDLPCQSYKFVQNSTASMRLIFQLSNGMGKTVNLSGTQKITVTNVGNTGVNTYNGTCWSSSAMVKGGDAIYCAFNIINASVVPSIHRNIQFDVALGYTDCETSPDYPYDCIGGLNRTAHGIITATFEALPAGVTTYCGGGTCTGGETCSSCPADCGCTSAGVCNSSCPTCSNILLACNATVGSGAITCSNSTGGKSGPLNYRALCCDGAVSSCGTNSTTCPATCADSTHFNTFPSNSVTCPRTCSSGSCQDCLPSCGTPTSTRCPYCYICSSGTCIIAPSGTIDEYMCGDGSCCGSGCNGAGGCGPYLPMYSTCSATGTWSECLSPHYCYVGYCI